MGTFRLTNNVPRFELKYRAIDPFVNYKPIYPAKGLDLLILDQLLVLKSIGYRERFSQLIICQSIIFFRCFVFWIGFCERSGIFAVV